MEPQEYIAGLADLTCSETAMCDKRGSHTIARAYFHVAWIWAWLICMPFNNLTNKFFWCLKPLTIVSVSVFLLPPLVMFFGRVVTIHAIVFYTVAPLVFFAPVPGDVVSVYYFSNIYITYYAFGAN